MFKFSLAKDILGMNARNLSYISAYNSAADKHFADDKIYTKRFLESRNIGVAKVFHIIHNYQQINHQLFSALPNKFAIKPNKGYAGGGILIIKEKKDNKLISVSGQKYSYRQWYQHCIDIVEGKYSISGVGDKVIIEELLETHSDFRELGPFGLPDIRVIVFNMVPVMAMLRVPTAQSEWKANMELGAIAMGLDIGTGKSIGASKYLKYIYRLDNGRSTKGFKVPFWNEVLSTASKTQNATNIGFLGVDLAITNGGVKVLEINARPGLKIQIPNRAPLKKRLTTVQGLKVITVEEGVQIAKTLFSDKRSEKSPSIASKSIIGIREDILFHGNKPRHLIAKISLEEEESLIKSEWYLSSVIDITIGGKRLKVPVKKSEIKGADLILSYKHLKDFIINPMKIFKGKTTKLTQDIDDRVMKNIDNRVAEIDEKIKIIHAVRPINIDEQKEIFFNSFKHSPRFVYAEPKIDIKAMAKEIAKIPEANHELYKVYKEKIEEMQHRLGLLEHIGKSSITNYSRKIFGDVDESLFKKAGEFIHEKTPLAEKDTSEIVDTKKIIAQLSDFLKQYNLTHWKITTTEGTIASIQISNKGSIVVRNDASCTKNRLQALMHHEIATHIFRQENAKVQSLRIFERGTADYVRTEEGLAIWNQNQLGLNYGEQYHRPAILVRAIYLAKDLGFVDLFHQLQKDYHLSNENAWTICLRVKRGMVNTEQTGGFTKDIAYFDGFIKVNDFIKTPEDGGKLYYGKIGINDIDWVMKIPNIKKPKLLPPCLK